MKTSSSVTRMATPSSMMPFLLLGLGIVMVMVTTTIHSPHITSRCQFCFLEKMSGYGQRKTAVRIIDILFYENH
jgi:hypothetical protein